jgi:hypothetical protein
MSLSVSPEDLMVGYGPDVQSILRLGSRTTSRVANADAVKSQLTAGRS